MREIKIITAQGSAGVIETNITTFGELKPFLRERNINLNSSKVLVAKNRNELSEDTALLPEEDFKIYIVASKNSGGTIENTLDDVNTTLTSNFEETQEMLSEIKNAVEYLSNDLVEIKETIEKMNVILYKLNKINSTPEEVEIIEDIEIINSLIK